jgi:hypothetical protein
MEIAVPWIDNFSGKIGNVHAFSFNQPVEVDHIIEEGVKFLPGCGASFGCLSSNGLDMRAGRLPKKAPLLF